MTPDSLTIRTLAIDHFGPWGSTEFTLPDAPLVVLHGPNESGKSCLATLVAWLLAGPHGKAEVARRFGAAGDKVGGRLSGSVRGLPFEAEGIFEILHKRTPNARGLTVHVGDRTLSAHAWSQHLGGLDATTLGAIYRLWGEDLHGGGDVTEALSTVALAGLSGQVDVRQLVDTLSDEVKAAATATGASDTSVQTLLREIERLGQHLAEAGQSADRHADARERLTELTNQRDLAVQQHAEFDRRHRVIDTVLAATGAHARLDELTTELQAVETVPPEWEHLAADPTAVRQAVDQLRQARDEVLQAHQHLTGTAGNLGIDADRAAFLAVTDGDVTELTRLVTRLSEYDKRAEHAALAAAAAAEAVASARTVTDEALVPTRDATRETLSGALLHTQTQVDLVQAVSTWQRCVGRAESEDEALGEARAAVDSAEFDAERARQAWTQWGTDLAPQQWIAGGSPGRAGPTVPAGVRRRTATAFVAGLVVAAASAALGQWLVAAVAGGASLGLLVTLLLSRHDAAVVPTHQATSLGEQAQAAQHMLAAQSALDEARKRTQQATTRRDRAHHEVRLAHQKALALCDGFGLPVAATAEATQGLHHAWFRAARALDAERQAEHHFESCRRSHEHACAEVSTLEQEIYGMASRIGLPVASPHRAADTLAAAALDAVTAWRVFDAAQSHLMSAEATWSTLLAPVTSQVEGWRPERVADCVCELAQRAEQGHKLGQLVEQAQRDLTTQLGSDPEVRSLHDKRLPGSELDALLAEADAERARADHERQSLSEQIGRLDTALDELATTERIARLRSEQGTLVEQQAELAVDALVAKVAGRVLRDVADQFERQHQPAIVEQATRLALAVATNWRNILVRSDGGQGLEVLVEQEGGVRLRADRLSTGGRALLYLAFRAAMAEHDAEQRGVRLPLLCDDPLVHLDDDRAREVMPVLAGIAERGHQVVLFTCHRRTVDAARDLGGAVLELPGLSARRR